MLTVIQRQMLTPPALPVDTFCACLVETFVTVLFVTPIPTVYAAPHDASSDSDVNDKAKPVGKRDWFGASATRMGGLEWW